jgi:hypothetical protein
MSAFANILKVVGFGPAKSTRGGAIMKGEFAAFLQPGKVTALTPPAWHALPGNRIELGATGFAIEARHEDPLQRAYWLYSPEGTLIANCGPMVLQNLKQLAEQLAKDRQEFVPMVGGWRL